MLVFSISIIFLQLGFCSGGYFASVSLINTTFNEGRSFGTAGALGHFVSACVTLSKISITSRLSQNAFLFDSRGGTFSCRDSEFEGLANHFGHFYGGRVSLESLSFRNSIRPVTGEASCRGIAGADRLNEETGDITVMACTFVGLDGGDDYHSEGGAIRLVGGGSLTITGDPWCRTEFHRCTSWSGWGVAVFAQVRSFTCDWVLFQDMTAEFSVLHIEEHVLDTFDPDLTMSHLEFDNITIEMTYNSDHLIQGGGSGLVIRYICGLELNDCSFTTCNFSGADNVKRAGALMFERSWTSDTIEKLALVRCTFTSTFAKTGCIYVNNPVRNFTINDCTIETCSGVSEDHPYSIYVNSRTPKITKLKMKNMPGGTGRIWLGDVATSSITFTECEFRSYSTPILFDWTGTNSIGLTLSWCIFNTVTSLTDNLFPLRSDSFNSLRISGCTFDDITARWALILGTAGTCRIDSGTSFRSIVIGVRYWRESIIFCSGYGRLGILILDQVSFESISQVPGILDIGGYWNTYVSITGVTCNRVILNGEDVQPMFRISFGTIAQFDSCTFIGCSSGDPIVHLERAPNTGIRNCVFESCSTGQSPILKVMFGELRLELCQFKSMTNLQASPVQIEASGAVSITGSFTFEQVRFYSVEQPLFEVMNVNTVSLDLTSVNISNCHFSDLVSPRLDQATVTCRLSESQFDTLFDVSGSLALNDCQFRGCTGQLITSGSISLTECEFHYNTVSDIALITVSSSITMSGCCFQGTSSGFYLSISSGATVSLTCPLCFDRSQSECVRFAGPSDPFGEFASQYHIFNCDACRDPVEPTSYPESDEDTSIIDDTSVIEEASMSDETSTNDEFSVADSESAPDPNSGGQGGKNGGLDGGLIAGIVIGILVIVAVVIVLVLVLLRRKKLDNTSSSVSSEHDMPRETADSSSDDSGRHFGSVDIWGVNIARDQPLFTGYETSDAGI